MNGENQPWQIDNSLDVAEGVVRVQCGVQKTDTKCCHSNVHFLMAHPLEASILELYHHPPKAALYVVLPPSLILAILQMLNSFLGKWLDVEDTDIKMPLWNSVSKDREIGCPSIFKHKGILE